jgi:L-cystine transport system substrate-binding protein
MIKEISMKFYVKRNSQFALLPAILLAVLAIAVFSTCKGKPVQDSAESGKVRQVIVGTNNTFKDFCFLDEKGNLVGFDIDILDEVDRLLPQYEFTYEAVEFSSILVGLEAGKYDLAAHSFSKNAERMQKFLYGAVPYSNYSYQIVVKAGRTDIQTLKDLEGKVVSVSTGSNGAYLFETYNKELAQTPITLVYGALDTETMVKGLDEGRYDAALDSIKRISDIQAAYNNKVEGVGPEMLPGYVYFLFGKGDTVLRDDVDAVVKTLRENGKLKEYSLKWFGGDYTQLIPEIEEEIARETVGVLK